MDIMWFSNSELKPDLAFFLTQISSLLNNIPSDTQLCYHFETSLKLAYVVIKIKEKRVFYFCSINRQMYQ